ncbi:DUF5994 family protein [Streptomyces sp. NPDC007172]|uniref:DUF5994 family protein n=1 Tax=Streptomyces sp. NPDC007172 TaxID=3364776 RepID=UPI0036C99912
MTTTPLHSLPPAAPSPGRAHAAASDSASGSARLRLTPGAGGPQPIDGVWWPRSDDLTAELPFLVRALPHSWPQIAHVTVNSAMWSAFPGRILLANHVIQLHRATARHAPDTICLLAPGRGRWDLRVVPASAVGADRPTG